MMKILAAAFLLLASSLFAQANDAFLNKTWTVESFSRTDEGVSAWSTAEVKAILKKQVRFETDLLRIGKQECKASLSPVPEKHVTDLGLLMDLNSEKKCGDTKPVGSVYSVSLECSAKVRFTPYLVLLANRRALGFGDTIELCLHPAP